MNKTELVWMIIPKQNFNAFIVGSIIEIALVATMFYFLYKSEHRGNHA